ncbi:MAG: malonyl-ACP O-methyltransferase BioC [Kangiellaceae bacterium]|nr:malonyl-ACP O-methyltransferase BioC [Kangiellaceae bacterium]
MSIEKKAIAESFSKAAPLYEASAFLQKEVASRLFERLEIMNVKPSNILDAGCGTGYCTRILNKQFPKANTVGVDLAPGMITQAELNEKKKGLLSKLSFSSKIKYQVADVEKLPFADNSFELVFSSLTLQWLIESKNVYQELNRVLKPGGLLIFSTLGPDTLIELKESWQHVDEGIHVNHFVDMHIVGDQVHAAQFENTVMDRDVITLTYQTMLGLMKDLKAIGAHNLDQNRSRGLLGKSKFKRLENHYESFRWDDGQLPATYEVVYGHAWKKKGKPKGDYHTYPVEVETKEKGKTV